MDPAWRSNLVASICIAIIVLVIAITALALATGRNESGIGVLKRGDCEEAERFALVSHGVINILSTLLLSAGNYTMQVLAAPSRDDVNTAHGRGISLSIGCQSFGNLKFVSVYRRLLWILLAVSSITLHLV